MQERERIKLKRIWFEVLDVGLHPAVKCCEEQTGNMIRLRVQAFIPTRKSEMRGLSLVSLAWTSRIDLDEDSEFRKMFRGSLSRIAGMLSDSDVVWLTNSNGFPDGREQLTRWLILNIPSIMRDLRQGVARQRALVLRARLAKSLDGLVTCPFCYGEVDAEHEGAADREAEAQVSHACEWIASRGEPKQCQCEKCAAERLEVFGAGS